MRPAAAVVVKGGMILIMAVYAGILTPHLAGLGLGAINVALAMFLQFLLSYLIPFVLARKLPLPERIAIAFANGVRNIVGGTIIAMAHLPPRVVLPLILGLLLQNPMGAAMYKVFASYCANLPGGRSPSGKEGERPTAKEKGGYEPTKGGRCDDEWQDAGARQSGGCSGGRHPGSRHPIGPKDILVMHAAAIWN